MADALFLFVQLEYPWLLGPPDGRYLLRSGPDSEPERVVVLTTLSAARASPPSRLLGRLGSRETLTETSPAPADVPTARVTLVDPIPLSTERQAQAWIESLDTEREIDAAVALLNRILHLHRVSAADPHVNGVSPEQAIAIRFGWGAGEQVADGRWLNAREVSRRVAGDGGARVARRSARRKALGHELRFAQLLGGRGAPLICEEIALRARMDLDRGQLPHAAIELDRAIACALTELPAEARHDLTLRIDELAKLREGVEEQARIALSGAGEGGPVESLDGEVITHALGRLEAALRARALRSDGAA
jgi:hypothetical protein